MPWWSGLSKAQWTVLAVAWLGWVFDIMDTALFNFAKVPMLTEMLGGEEAYRAHGPAVEAQILAVFLVGWSLGGVVFGVLADRWGRTKVMALTILMYAGFTGLTALCADPAQVLVVRFLTALGIGGEWAAGAALVAEAVPDRARAGAASLLQSAAAVGPVLAAVANLAVPAAHWRWLFLIGVAPAVVAFFIRRSVPEPERWVASQASEAGQAHPLRCLFSEPRWRRNAVVALVLGTVGISLATMVSFWLPNLVKAVSEAVSPDEVQRRTSWATMSLHVGTLLGVFAMPWLCGRVGRRRALLAFFLGAPASVVLVTVLAKDYGSLLLAAPLMSFFAIGLSAGFVLYFPELFPTSLRATGAGLAYNGGRILAAGVPLATAALIGQAGSVADGVARTAVALSVGIVALAFAPETRGRPLPD